MKISIPGCKEKTKNKKKHSSHGSYRAVRKPNSKRVKNGTAVSSKS